MLIRKESPLLFGLVGAANKPMTSSFGSTQNGYHPPPYGGVDVGLNITPPPQPSTTLGDDVSNAVATGLSDTILAAGAIVLFAVGFLVGRA